MSPRIPLKRPEQLKQLIALNDSIKKAAADAGLDPLILELCKIRASQLNGCAFCLDMHIKDVRDLGETEQRVYLLGVWREANVYNEQERAALALTDAMTRLSETQDVPDDVYQQATAVFTRDQYTVLGWAVTVINAFNRLNVTSRTPVPAAK
ncbi:carboxymuconolactone decarboxylase family protein [Amycolatopsis alkalitolerans]|uniref:Carboxymuconolactone decarboxylase family protein n=1 Tax=Amycolatopsis alkalitolerans TaxID=2547244 RepID=A0A5C4M1D9_9PSEU|nr:carboxymuconolactone decarboxylase family protein [Amycolatopsis alkalitolerans]TNC24602.1 carboxymuconolactone decarboxylase family protein [Amycolatopsis alkalitolerans]